MYDALYIIAPDRYVLKREITEAVRSHTRPSYESLTALNGSPSSVAASMTRPGDVLHGILAEASSRCQQKAKK